MFDSTLTITQNDIVSGAPLQSPEAISMFRPCNAHMAERAIEPRRRRRASALHSRRCVSRGATGTSTRPPPPQMHRRGESQRRQNLERAAKAARVGGVRVLGHRPGSAHPKGTRPQLASRRVWSGRRRAANATVLFCGTHPRSPHLSLRCSCDVVYTWGHLARNRPLPPPFGHTRVYRRVSAVMTVPTHPLP